MGRVVVIGASMTDMNLRLAHLPAAGQTLIGSDFFIAPGGKGANQAIAARRAGAEVAFLSAVGDDEFSRKVLEHDRAEGLDVSHMKVVPGATSGVAMIFVGDDGENLIGVAMNANSHLKADDIDRLPAELFRKGDVLLASLEVPLDAVARAIDRAADAGMTVVLNPAPAALAIIDLGVLPKVDVITPNRSEAGVLTGRTVESRDQAIHAARSLIAMGVKTVVLTLGGEGALIVEEAGETPISPFKVPVVDTVGAGDAFNGALAVALGEGRSLAEAARWAAAAAAIAVTKPGAQGALPTRAEIDALVSPNG